MTNGKRKETVLVVDDEQEFCKFIEDCLRPQGYRVHSVNDGAAALASLDEGIDLVLCDHRMKGLNGLEVIEKVKALDPAIPIIMITAFGSIDQAVDAMRVGAYDYLTKPVAIEDLRKHVERALETRTLRSEVVRLRKLAEDRSSLEGIVAESEAMRQVVATVRQLEDSTSNVLIAGESGTGKELIARAIHMHSPVCDGPFVPVNCAAIPEHLLESELFGHTRGAFTDARTEKAGLFHTADGGTLFLDEVGELAQSLQAKLLRVLEEGTVRRLGATKNEEVTVRIVAATNRQLEDELDDTFRSDLYYRLNVVEIRIPPLRERREDLPALITASLEQTTAGGETKRLSPEALDLLKRHPWPGNVRQLRNAIEHAVALCAGDVITPENLPESVRSRPESGRTGNSMLDGVDPSLSLAELEDIYIKKVLEHTGGNRTAAAGVLGIDRKTLYKRLRKRPT